MRPSGTPPKIRIDCQIPLEGLMLTTAIYSSIKPVSVRFLMKIGASSLLTAPSPIMFGLSQFPDSMAKKSVSLSHILNIVADKHT